MEEMSDKASIRIDLPAAVLFTVQAVWLVPVLGQQIIYALTEPMMESISTAAAILVLMQLTAHVVCAAALYRGRRDASAWLLLATGTAVLTSVAVISLFQGFGYGAYSATDAELLYTTCIGPPVWKFQPLCMLPNLSVIGGLTGMLAMVVARWTDRGPAVRRMCRKLWYLPGVLVAGEYLLSLFLVWRLDMRGLYWFGAESRTNLRSCVSMMLAAVTFLLTARWVTGEAQN